MPHSSPFQFADTKRRFVLYDFQFTLFMLLTSHVLTVCIVQPRTFLLSSYTWAARHPSLLATGIPACSLLFPRRAESLPTWESHLSALLPRSFWTIESLDYQGKMKRKKWGKKMQQWFSIASPVQCAGPNHKYSGLCCCNHQAPTKWEHPSGEAAVRPRCMFSRPEVWTVWPFIMSRLLSSPGSGIADYLGESLGLWGVCVDVCRERDRDRDRMTETETHNF